MPYRREREREQMRELNERSRNQGDLLEESFPMRGLTDNGQGINPREPVETIDLTGVPVLGFGPMSGMTT